MLYFSTACNDEWQRRGNGPSNINNAGKSPSGGGGHKSRKILRILGKLRRSNSGGLENEVGPERQPPDTSAGENGKTANPFIGGGIRATAAPRLGWAREQTPVKL